MKEESLPSSSCSQQWCIMGYFKTTPWPLSALFVLAISSFVKTLFLFYYYIQFLPSFPLLERCLSNCSDTNFFLTQCFIPSPIIDWPQPKGVFLISDPTDAQLSQQEHIPLCHPSVCATE